VFQKSRDKLFKKESGLVLTDTNIREHESFINNLDIDAVFTVTPFHKQEDLLLRACKRLGKKMITSILSFDNITKRGWMPVTYDVYMVWNSYNKDQLHRIYPYTKRLCVEITGAAQFDFYFNQKFLLQYEQWKRNTGLPLTGNRKIILYAGGPEILFPNEPQYLQHIAEAIAENKIKNNPIVLFRCHPTDRIGRWKNIAIDSCDIVFDSSWTGGENVYNANVSYEDIKKLCSTLAYTDVHINLCSTMTVDGSAFKKPQIGPAYDEIRPEKEYLLKQMYFQEHFMPVVETNALKLATSKQELIDHINNALEQPEAATANSEDVLKKIITYTDGNATGRVAECIKNFFTEQPKLQEENFFQQMRNAE